MSEDSAARRTANPPEHVPATVLDGFTLSAVGDCIPSRPLVQLADRDAGFAKVVELLASSDVVFGNLETAIAELDAPDVYPNGTANDFAVLAAPAVAKDLRALGLGLVGRANNHAMDWGVGGMRRTTSLLDDVGLVHAGAGESLSAARAARYVETPRGRVALVSATTSPTPETAAAIDPFGEVPARPGVHALRVGTTVIAPPDLVALLRELRETHPDADTAWMKLPEDGPVELFSTRFVQGRSLEVRHELDPEDVLALVRSLRQGRQHADLAVLCLHVHQNDRRPEQPPTFVRDLAHTAIEQGADIVVVSGPHRLAPIELYQGRPVLYGLGNFLWSDVQEPLQRYFWDRSRERLGPEPTDPNRVTDAELLERINEDAFDDPEIFEAVVATARFSDGRLGALRLTPVDLGKGQPLTRRGVPRMPDAETGARILERIREISAPLGTDLMLEDGTGVVHPEP